MVRFSGWTTCSSMRNHGRPLCCSQTLHHYRIDFPSLRLQVVSHFAPPFCVGQSEVFGRQGCFDSAHDLNPQIYDLAHQRPCPPRERPIYPTKRRPRPYQKETFAHEIMHVVRQGHKFGGQGQKFCGQDLVLNRV